MTAALSIILGLLIWLVAIALFLARARRNTGRHQSPDEAAASVRGALSEFGSLDRVQQTWSRGRRASEL